MEFDGRRGEEYNTTITPRIVFSISPKLSPYPKPHHL